MKVTAIIAEYNPFHNGHFYQINTVKEQLEADYVIVIMSGDFMQRGIPALIDKYARSQMALLCGADLIFELPSYFALGSAEYFAQGAISLIDKLGVVDFVHFGSECGDISLLEKCARIIANEPTDYKEFLSKYLKAGKSYPSARQEALKELFPEDKSDIDSIFSSPNNILGIEYIKAILQRKSAIKPATLKRQGNGYSSLDIDTEGFSSANAIRNALESGDISPSLLCRHMPPKAFEILKAYTDTGYAPLYLNDFSQVLLYKLLQEGADKSSFVRFYDIGKPLSNTIYNNIMDFTSFSDFALNCKSKNLTYTRITRSLMHILLDMRKEPAELLKAHDYSLYARLLGFSLNGQTLLKAIKANSSVPIITKPVNALKTLDNIGAISLKMDIHAANIYESIKQQKSISKSASNIKIKNELTSQLIRPSSLTQIK